MRKILEVIALAVLVFQTWITVDAFYGPHRLPDRIPIHFDQQGMPNGWGTPADIPFFFPLIALGVYLLLAVIARFPESFNYPVAVNDSNRGRLQTLTLGMLTWMRMEIPCLFAAIQGIILQAARHPQGGFSPRIGWIILGLVILLLGTVGWHIAAMFRARSDAGPGQTPGLG